MKGIFIVSFFYHFPTKLKMQDKGYIFLTCSGFCCILHGRSFLAVVNLG